MGGEFTERRTDLHVAVYLDDFVFGAKSRAQLQEGLVKVEEICKELGVVFSDSRESGSTQRAEYLGLMWDTERKTVSMDGERRRQHRREVSNLLRHASRRRCGRSLLGGCCFRGRQWSLESGI